MKNRSKQYASQPSLGNHIDRIRKFKNDELTEKAATSMLGFLTSHAGFDALRAALMDSGADRPNMLLGEFIFFRYFALFYHANRQIADDRVLSILMAAFLQKIKTCFRLNPTLRTIGSSFEKFEEEAGRRNDLLATGLKVVKEKELGGDDDVRAALASFLITLRILYPQLAIDRNSIPPAMITLMQKEFSLAAEQMARIAQSAGSSAEA